jgi:beta-glucanase (GH16 family)
MTSIRWFLAILLALLSASAAAQNWQLVWQEEFDNGISGNWRFETGTGASGWGNNELQFYRRENATVENGSLLITARREDFNGSRYTSARMSTQGFKSFRYGRIEARIKLPAVLGTWPAFWMLGTNIGSVGWPASGEIDIMEQVNTDARVLGTVHWQDNTGRYAQYSGNTDTSTTDWHTYAVEWDPGFIRWFVDGRQYHVTDIRNGINGTEEFQREFFIILNMAVGGNLPGFNVNNAALPARMYVDYVRVFAAGASLGTRAWAPQNFAGSVIRHQDGRGRIDAGGAVAPIADANWNMVPGLAGQGVSFQSQNFPDRYLRHRGGEVWLDVSDGSPIFREDATFLTVAGLANGAATSFQSFNYRDRYLRHRNSLLYVEAVPSAGDRSDATFGGGSPLSGFAATLDAAAYADMQGMQLEPSGEGGQNLGYIDANDWAVWNLNVPSAGAYTVEYRVASAGGGGVLQLERAGGGQVHGSLAVPRSGGWQNWTTIAHRVLLPAGQQQIAIKALAGGWNIKSVRVVR